MNVSFTELIQESEDHCRWSIVLQYAKPSLVCTFIFMMKGRIRTWLFSRKSIILNSWYIYIISNQTFKVFPFPSIILHYLHQVPLFTQSCKPRKLFKIWRVSKNFSLLICMSSLRSITLRNVLNPGAPSVQLRGAQGWARVMQTAQLWIQCKMTSSPWCRNDLETW